MENWGEEAERAFASTPKKRSGLEGVTSDTVPRVLRIANAKYEAQGMRKGKEQFRSPFNAGATNAASICACLR